MFLIFNVSISYSDPYKSCPWLSTCLTRTVRECTLGWPWRYASIHLSDPDHRRMSACLTLTVSVHSHDLEGTRVFTRLMSCWRLVVVAGALPPLRAHILRRVRVARGGVRPPARAVEGLLRVPHAAAAARRALLQHRPAALARLAQPPQPPAAAHSRSGPDRFST